MCKRRASARARARVRETAKAIARERDKSKSNSTSKCKRKRKGKSTKLHVVRLARLVVSPFSKFRIRKSVSALYAPHRLGFYALASFTLMKTVIC